MIFFLRALLQRVAGRDLEFHPVRAEGQFLNDKELYLNAQALKGDQGFHIVTPFQLADGRMMMIDRGFVPTERRDPATREAGEIAGPTTVIGLLRLPEPPGMFTRASSMRPIRRFAIQSETRARSTMPFTSSV